MGGMGEGGWAERVQAEGVAEAIIRHQDVQDKGRVGLLTRLVHLGTLVDNVGAGVGEEEEEEERGLVGKEMVRVVDGMYKREGWGGCFKETVRRELEVKPWAMVGRIEGFEERIEGWRRVVEGG